MQKLERKSYRDAVFVQDFLTRCGSGTICAQCVSQKKRNESSNVVCLFKDCKGGTKSYCPHFHRCFICDAPHSCEKLCRLSRGNGEHCIALVDAIRPNFLLLDFDRTLASTKSGGSPLPKKTARSRIKEDYMHSIDSELKIAVFAQQAFGESHVVTRNSHKKEIEDFLRMHGLSDLAANVHVVPKKMAKGAFIRENFLASQDKNCIFVDDDIRELSNDPWLWSSKQVHRLLFVRAFL
uniref:Uncharacterized protein n=1 Tax=Proboscia inermis TaxID=420281 RepID=A0A7S0GIP6_9STRA|mmetsp:Transcript_6295/g.6501  ORF Transcript_6295/g.6501 Transcript_6295/m.6501 type:complete len:237 (+) Transcript_6295:69-779(+)